MSAQAHPVFSMTEKIKKSARTGKTARFTAAEIEILLRDEIYLAITRLEAEEMRKSCDQDADNDNSSAASGSGNVPTQGRGAFAGASADEMDAMSRGARLRLCEAMSEIKNPEMP